MNPDGQTYWDLDDKPASLEDLDRMVRAEQEEARERAEQAYTRAMEDYYEQQDVA